MEEWHVSVLPDQLSQAPALNSPEDTERSYWKQDHSYNVNTRLIVIDENSPQPIAVSCVLVLGVLC